jgi:hypothetical protein
MGKIKEINMKESRQNFSKNVFINCPFDDEYIPLLRPILFTLIYLGYNPRIASERFDSAEQRIVKICDLIQSSMFSIHDLSRTSARRRNEIYRLNMPLELGIDYGCRLFKGGETNNKTLLIFEHKPYALHRALSNLSGVDVKAHGNESEKVVRELRNWFVTNELGTADSPSTIWDNFNEFMTDFYQKIEGEGFLNEDLQIMPIPEYINFIREWLAEKRAEKELIKKYPEEYKSLLKKYIGTA